jgi:hypothetical protein
MTMAHAIALGTHLHLALAFSAPTAQAVHQRADITVDQIRARLAVDSASVVVRDLMEVDEQQQRAPHWDYVLSQIETGATAWLAVAMLLSPGADGAAGEDLLAAEAEALPHAPAFVLRLFGSEVCFIPDGTWPASLTAFQAMIAKRTRKILEVQDRGLSAEKAACIRSYRQNAKEAVEHYH